MNFDPTLTPWNQKDLEMPALQWKDGSKIKKRAKKIFYLMQRKMRLLYWHLVQHVKRPRHPNAM